MRLETDRTAQDQRGSAVPGAAEFGKTPPQLPAADIDAVVARRVAMLLRFMRAARVVVSHAPPLTRRGTSGRKGGGGSKGRKGKQTGGGAVKPRREQRVAHHKKRLKNLGRRIVVKPYDDGPPDVRPPRRPPPRPS